MTFSSYSRINSILLSIALFSLLTINVEKSYATTPIVHISSKPSWILLSKPYDKKPASRNVENGAYDELIEEQVNVEEHATYNHVITQIISESGVQNNSEISVSFNPAYERLDFHEIIVWRNNKSEMRLNAGAFKVLPQEDEIEKFIYNGTYSAKCILSDIRKGDKIEYAYTITGSNPIFNGKFCRSIYLQASHLIVHQYTTLLFSTDRKINIKSFNLLSQPKISVAGKLKRYEWEDFQVPSAPTNKYEPEWVNNYAHVQVSDFSNWAEVIDWALKINPIQTNFTGELADTIASLKKQSGNDKEKYFRLAVRLVQDEIRYMGIETGEYSHRANTPDKVFKQRYGDCKDKSLLLASILNAGGIEAHLVLLNTDLKDKINDLIPSATLFNHMTVVANVNGKQVYIDATISNQRGKGIDLYYPPYREGLVLKPGNSALTKIDEAKKGKIVCEEKFIITDEHSPVKFKVTTTYTLNQADETRDQLASTGTAKTEKNYLDYYSKTFSKIEASDSIIVKDNEEKNELTTIENYTIKDFFKLDSTNSKYTADFYADDISRQLPNINGQIKTPVSVSYPYDMDFTTTIILPYGWDIVNDHYVINRNAYKFSFDQTVSDYKLSLRYQFAYLKDHLAADELSEFKDDVKKLKDDKLSFSFFYIPDIGKVPFQLNKYLVIVTILVMAIFIYGGIRVFRMDTRDTEFNTSNNSFPPALGGWLIVLIIILIATPLGAIKNLIDDDFYSVSKWNLFTVGISSIVNRGQLFFEIIGKTSIICLSIFCLVLIFKKRDITPRFLKLYYLSVVAFLFVDFLLNAFIKGNFSSDEVVNVVEKIMVAVIWTYYLNISTRVRQTFVVPYPN
ncbi:MAG TPA: DUF3857 domain-containing protein [Mucilaginibacter sp.]|jgi:hypothetical protein